MNSLVIKMEQIEHFSHNHPLFLRDEKKNDEDECCSACTLPISTSSPSYGCNQCKEFVLHRSCAELPQQIDHPFHSRHPPFQEHPLTLLQKVPYGGVYSCNACRKDWSVGFVYRCAACAFDLDIGCALLSPTIKYEGHDHLLTLFEKIYDDDRLCNSCGTTFEASSVLRCVDCDFNCHESSCSDKSYDEMHKQIDHPFHPFHPLRLTHHVGHDKICDSCSGWSSDFSFGCEECHFRLCLECISLAPTIKYENHDHLLTFFKKIRGNEDHNCRSCNSVIRENFLFRCVQCSFDIHTKCIPWLTTIKHKCHIHPLTITDGLVGDEGSGNFYCDACETERDPNNPVYYCSECNFVADIKCVIDEVLPKLIEEKESDATAKKEEIKPASIVKGFLDANTVGEVKPRGDQAIVSSEEDGIGITEDPALMKLEEDIEKLHMEEKEQIEKLVALGINADIGGELEAATDKARTRYPPPLSTFAQAGSSSQSKPSTNFQSWIEEIFGTITAQIDSLSTSVNRRFTDLDARIVELAREIDVLKLRQDSISTSMDARAAETKEEFT